MESTYKHKCTMCENKQDDACTLHINKISYRFGYMPNYLVPRYFCSEKCMNDFKHTCLCPSCNSIFDDFFYEGYKKQGNDDYYYHDEIIVGDKSCYNKKFN